MTRTLATLQQMVNLLFGVSAPATLEQQRYVRIIQAVVAGIAQQGTQVILRVLSVTFALPLLAQERFGIWVTIQNLMLWMTLADFGIANGLISDVARAYSEDHHEEAQRYVAAAFWLLTGLCLILLLIFVVIWLNVDWAGLLKVETAEARAEVGPAIGIAVALFILNLPLTLTPRIYHACQHGHIGNLWLMAGNLLSIVAFVVVITVQGSLTALVVATFGSTLLVACISTAWLYFRSQPQLRPSFSALDWSIGWRLGRDSFQFLLIQFAWLVLFQTDNMIIASQLGAGEVASYSIAWDLFLYTGFLSSVLTYPLWSSYSAAFAKRNMRWIRRTFFATTGLSLLVTAVLVGVLLLLGRQIIDIWSRGTVTADQTLLIGMAAWTLLSVWGRSIASVLNSIKKIRLQAIAGVLTAILNVVLSLYWIQIYGLVGVIMATVVAYSILIVPLSVQTLRVLLQPDAEGLEAAS
ncbi:MAG: hypothetical protein IT320_26285 [Anaerolineae bacterium]|nr:hypothetical protein [Anaerolineae bacterium]